MAARVSRSLRSSADLRGGGGEGGFDEPNLGDLGGGKAFAGESGRLGMLCGLEEPPGVSGADVVGSRKGD